MMRCPHCAAWLIEQLGGLVEGWNGHRAAPVSAASREAAVRLLCDAAAECGTAVPTPVVAPTPDGGVALEWIVKDGEERIVEIICLPTFYECTVRNRRTGKVEDEAEMVDRRGVVLQTIKRYVSGHFVLAR